MSSTGPAIVKHQSPKMLCQCRTTNIAVSVERNRRVLTSEDELDSHRCSNECCCSTMFAKYSIVFVEHTVASLLSGMLRTVG